MRPVRTLATTTALLAAGGAALLLPAPASAGSVTASGPLTAFVDPYGDRRPNPVPVGASARVHVVQTGAGSSVVTLHVAGLPAHRSFGAHVHKASCADEKGRGHYMHDVTGGATRTNEVWLDLTTDEEGVGGSKAKADWTFRSAEVGSVVLHDRHTDPANGTAGPKLACLDVTLQG